MKCMKRIKTITAAVFAFILSGFVVHGAQPTELAYRETTGKKVEEVSYTIEEADSAVYIRADYHDEDQVITTDRNFNTKNLQIIASTRTDTISIHRDDDRLVIAGKIKKSVPIKSDISWYQLPFCLKSFILSEDNKISFYGLSSNFDERLSQGKGIQMIRLSARKEAVEQIEVCGRQVEAVKVLISFEYIPAIFWKAYYWYRADDGLLVRYSEPRGAPGTPKTNGELIYEGGSRE